MSFSPNDVAPAAAVHLFDDPRSRGAVFEEALGSGTRLRIDSEGDAPRIVDSFDALPRPVGDYSYERAWWAAAIVPGSPSECLGTPPVVPGGSAHAGGWSLRESDPEWVILPGGGVSSYRTLAFVTRNEALAARLAGIAAVPRRSKGSSAGAHRLLVSRLRPGAIPSTDGTAVVLEEGDGGVSRELRRALDLYAAPPLVVFYEFDPGTLCASWERARFRVVDHFTVVQDTRLSIYRPEDPESLDEMLAVRELALCTLMVFPPGTPTGAIADLLAVSEPAGARPDPTLLEHFRQAAPWVYALGRGHVDQCLSLVVSRTSPRIGAVVDLASAARALIAWY